MSSNEYMRVYMIDRYHKRRNEALQRLGNRCNQCPITEDLEFDHIDPSTKLFTIGKMWSVSKLKFEEELKKCQLLCRKCHEAKSIIDAGYKPARNIHGTLSSYRYCKCALCKAAKSNYSKTHKKPKPR